MATLGVANALRELGSNQKALQRDVTQLSSGLRINTAADDPAGLAISESLQSEAASLDQGAANVQEATNALTVADGALATVTDILQRIQSLAIEASSDTASDGDRARLQVEAAQLVVEINTISQNTSFNGTPLLDGSHAGFIPATPASLVVSSNAVLASTSGVPPNGQLVNGNFSEPPLPANTSVRNVAPAGWEITTNPVFPFNKPVLINGSLAVSSNPPPSGDQYVSLGDATTLSQTIQGLQAGTYALSFSYSGVTNPNPIAFNGGDVSVLVDGNTVQSFTSASQTDPLYSLETVLFTIAATGSHTIEFEGTGRPLALVGAMIADVSLTALSLAPSTAAPTASSGLLIASAVAVNANFQTTVGGTAGLGGTGTTDGTIEVQVVNTGVSIAAVETFIDSATGLISVSPTLYAPGSTASAFDNVAVTLGNFGEQDVGTSAFTKVFQQTAATESGPALSVQDGADEGALLDLSLPGVNAAKLRVSNINLAAGFLSAEDAIGQVSGALSSVLQQRAQLGAQIVRLSDEEQNDNVAATNLTASESLIRDANIAAVTSDFVRRQVVASIGTDVIQQSNANASNILALFNH